MALSFRQSEILDIAKTQGRVVVEDLAQRFDVTLQTIRRDLTELADMGYVDRVHGGAVPRTGVANLGYDERRRLNEGAKTAIARPARLPFRTIRRSSSTLAPRPRLWRANCSTIVT